MGPQMSRNLQNSLAGTPEGYRDFNEKQRKEKAVNAQRCGLHGVVRKGYR